MLRGGRTAVDVLDARRGRAAPGPRQQRVERRRAALRDRLHVAGGAVSHPAGDAQPFGFAAHGVTEPDPLNSAADAQANCAYLQNFSGRQRRTLKAPALHGKLNGILSAHPAGRKDESKGDESMRAALIVVAILALAGFLAVAVVLPQMAGSEAREAAQALIAGADGARQQIAAVAQKSGSLAGTGKDLKLPARTDPKHGELKWIIETNGAIRGWNEKNAIEISITPALQGGTVTWNCRGYPITAMPASCGGKS